jgi:hypothetical protein
MVSIEVVWGVASVSFLSIGFCKGNSASPSYKEQNLANFYWSGRVSQTNRYRQARCERRIRKGFVPGRGILGRAVECGLEVSSDTLKRGQGKSICRKRRRSIATGCVRPTCFCID